MRGLSRTTGLAFPLRESNRAPLAVIGSLLSYTAAFAWLQTVIGPGAAALATVPVAVAGWYLGMVAGMVAAILSVPLNTLLLSWFGFAGLESVVSIEGGLSTAVFMLVGIVAGGLGKIKRGSADQSLEVALGKQALDARTAQLQKVESALRLTESSLADILGGAQEAIVSIDDARRIVFFNHGAEKMFGYLAQEVIGRPSDVLLPERLVAAYNNDFSSFMEGNGTKNRTMNSVVLHGRRKDGTELPAEASLSTTRMGDRTVYTAILRDITRRVKAEEAERLRSAELEALVTILSISVQPGTFEEKAERMVEEVARIVQVEDAGLQYLDDRDGGVRLVAEVHAQPEPGSLAVKIAIPFGEGVDCNVIRDGQAIIANDYAAHPLAMPGAVECGIRSLAALPVRFDGQAIGALTVWSRELNHFTDDRLRLLSAVADEVGTFLETARLLERERAHSREQEALFNIASVLAQAGTMESKAARVLDELATVVRADRAVLRLVNEQESELELVAVTTPGMPEIATEKSIPIDSGLPGLAIRRGEVVVVNDYASHPQAVQNNVSRGIRSAAIFPIRASGRILGTLNVHRKEANHFTEERVRLLAAIVAEIGVLLESALLNGRLKRSNAELTQRAADLREAQEYSQRLVASLQHAVAVVDDDLNVVSANRAFYRALGLGQRRVESKRLTDIGRLHGIALLAKSAFGSNGSNRERDIIYNHPRKGRRWFRVSASDLEKGQSMTGGDKRHLVLSLEDVTDWQRAQEKVHETSRLVSLGEIIGGVAHELNNPLTSVMGFSQLLLEQEKDGPNRADLEMIFKESQRAAKVVSNLLAFVRKREITKQWVALANPLERVLALKSYDLRVGNIEVDCVIEPDLPLVHADEHQLEQVFLNLVTNGQQAMTNANGRGLLKIDVSSKNESVLLSFVDDGPGIPAADLRTIFDPFFTTKGPEQGTGLGLSICKGLVQEQGGKIWAESEEGQGAVFYVELPAKTKVKVARS